MTTASQRCVHPLPYRPPMRPARALRSGGSRPVGMTRMCAGLQGRMITDCTSARRRWQRLSPGRTSAPLLRAGTNGKPVVLVLVHRPSRTTVWRCERRRQPRSPVSRAKRRGGFRRRAVRDVNPVGKHPNTFPALRGAISEYYAHRASGAGPTNRKIDYVDESVRPLKSVRPRAILPVVRIRRAVPSGSAGRLASRSRSRRKHLVRCAVMSCAVSARHAVRCDPPGT
jgi:hypothetical protein